MKNLILIFVFLLIGSVGAAQEQQDSVKISNTERIIDKYVGKVVEGFNNLVEKATPVAEQGFKIAVRLQIAKGISLVLIPIAFIIFLRLFIAEHKRLVELYKDNGYHTSPWSGDNTTFQLAFYCCAVVCLAIASPFCLYAGLTRLIAPEWFAIKEIIELF